MTRSSRGTVEQPGTRVAQKRGLNRAIRRSGWGQLVTRLQHKACARVEQVPAAYTSQRCSTCGHVAPGNRKSQAVFECEACTAGRCNADVNAARNIAAGRAVTARGDLGASRSANLNLNSPLPRRKPMEWWAGIPGHQSEEDVNFASNSLAEWAASSTGGTASSCGFPACRSSPRPPW
jgi:putative transposase